MMRSKKDKKEPSYPEDDLEKFPIGAVMRAKHSEFTRVQRAIEARLPFELEQVVGFWDKEAYVVTHLFIPTYVWTEGEWYQVDTGGISFKGHNLYIAGNKATRLVLDDMVRVWKFGTAGLAVNL